MALLHSYDPVAGQSLPSTWKFSTPNNPAQLLAAPAPLYDGHGALRFEIRHSTDPAGATNPTYRCEIDTTQSNPVDEFKLGQEYWVGLNLYIPPEFQVMETGEIVVQWHHRPDQAGKGYPDPYNIDEPWTGNPPMGVRIKGDVFQLSTRYNPHHDPVTGTDHSLSKAKTSTVDTALFKPTAARGRWLSLVFHFKCSYEETGGFTKLYMAYADTGNHVLVAHHTTGNAYNNYPQNYLKVGVYKSLWNDGRATDSGVTQRVFYFTAG